MKTLTLTSEFFQNECAESFCKAILGNNCVILKDFDSVFGGFLFGKFLCSNSSFNCWNTKSVTFKLDDSFSVDWACLHSHGYCYSINLGGNVLNLDYLVTLQGVIIEEAEE